MFLALNSHIEKEEFRLHIGYETPDEEAPTKPTESTRKSFVPFLWWLDVDTVYHVDGYTTTWMWKHVETISIIQRWGILHSAELSSEPEFSSAFVDEKHGLHATVQCLSWCNHDGSLMAAEKRSVAELVNCMFSLEAGVRFWLEQFSKRPLLKSQVMNRSSLLSILFSEVSVGCDSVFNISA